MRYSNWEAPYDIQQAESLPYSKTPDKITRASPRISQLWIRQTNHNGLVVITDYSNLESSFLHLRLFVGTNLRPPWREQTSSNASRKKRLLRLCTTQHTSHTFGISLRVSIPARDCEPSSDMTAEPIPQNAEQNFVRILGFDETKTSSGEDSSCPYSSPARQHNALPNNTNGNTNGDSFSAGLSQSPPGGLTLSFNPGWSASQTPSSSFSSPSSEARFSELELLRARYDVKHNQLAGLFLSAGGDNGGEKSQSRYTQNATNTLHGIMFGVTCPSGERQH